MGKYQKDSSLVLLRLLVCPGTLLYDERMQPDELREQIELEIVELIRRKLESGEITEGRAKQLAQRALDVLKPGMSFDQLYKAIPTLDDTIPELAPVVLPHIKDYEVNVTAKALENVRNLIAQGQYDAAATLGKKASNRDVELVWSANASPDAK